ncbi:MAG: EthD domain-containing protein [Pseudomonadales bacterium]|jgi:hypothetical protein|nr:EthD domain-containing protein [Pseudomonadales bacterium]MDP7357249.1 EthD domain-containing protein [Pseudomonadales bacterium]MDP7596832.1 EthD domain-containing protein [Pseudomonadales bacterium]HJN52797.1 EthD domain-containing protein [Pseudomonadales bacterium]|tara:strand:- start:295 stop:927 length:633 start_codon:yes stop_codon:yes gene_type:complete
MLKMMVTVVRRAEVSHQELVRAWEEIHAPHILKLWQPERYKISLFGSADRFPHPALDGMAELWFRDEEHLRSALAQVSDDAFGEYADYSKVLWYPVDEYLNVDGSTSRETTKLVYFLKRKEGVDRSEFQQVWLDVHRPNVAAAVKASPRAQRYTVSLVTSAEELAYDGVAQIWMEGNEPSIADLHLEPDAFSDLIGVLHGCRSHELSIVD